jgi:hypothetical protein
MKLDLVESRNELQLNLAGNKPSQAPLAVVPYAARTVGNAVSFFWGATSDPLDLLSLFAIGITIAFLSTGSYFTYKQIVAGTGDIGDSAIGAAAFYLPCLAFMFTYSRCYAALFNARVAKSDPNYTGCVSARAVIQWIAILTAASFATTGSEIIALGNPSDYPCGVAFCFGVPGTIVLFMFAHGAYIRAASDMLRGGRRRGSGRQAMKIMTVMAMVAFVFNVVFCIHQNDVFCVWWSLAWFTVASCGSIFLSLFYQHCVTVADDRGCTAE